MKVPGRVRSQGGMMVALVLWLLILTNAPDRPAAAQTLDVHKQRGHTMLDVIRKDLEKNYYDPRFHGVDLPATFHAADDKVGQAQSVGQIFGIIAQAMLELDDSHTFFVPPARAARIEYGWQMGMVGERCYVTAVKPGSDAALAGLHLGDEVLAVDGRQPVREKLWLLNYLYYTLRPQAGMTVLVQRPDGKQETLAIKASVREEKLVVDLTGDDFWREIRDAESEARLHRHRYQDDLADTFVWKMPQFDLDDRDVDRTMARIGARHNLILDLRGNGGGLETTLFRLIGNLFDHDVTIGSIHRRQETKPFVAKTRGEKIYKGRVFVLIDHGSGSAAEVFARVMQLEKRGTVIGDRSAGAVMRSRFHPYRSGADRVVFYGASITDADVVMADGKSLEKAGVTPDEMVLPAAGDLAAQRDPAFSRAATLAGLELDPVRAGSMFPIEWRR